MLAHVNQWHTTFLQCSESSDRTKNECHCLLLSDFSVSVEFSEVGKHGKQHIEHSDSKLQIHLSGEVACVLLTTDERTTGRHCCSDVSDCLF